MKARDLNCRYPLLGYAPNSNMGVTPLCFENLGQLTTCGAYGWKDGWAQGLEIIDMDGRQWKVVSARRVGYARPWYWTIFRMLLSIPLYRIEYDFEEKPDASLAEVQDRVCEIFKIYRDEDDYTDEYKAETIADIATLRATTRIDELPPLLEWDGMGS